MLKTPSGAASPAPAGILGRAPLIPPDGLTPTQLAQELGVSLNTVCRWIRTGIRGPRVDGQRPMIRLEARRIGGRSIVSLAAFERFSAALSGRTEP